MSVLRETFYKWSNKHRQLNQEWTMLQNGLLQKNLGAVNFRPQRIWGFRNGCFLKACIFGFSCHHVCISASIIWLFGSSRYDIADDRPETQGGAHRCYIRTDHSTNVPSLDPLCLPFQKQWPFPHGSRRSLWILYFVQRIKEKQGTIYWSSTMCHFSSFS